MRLPVFLIVLALQGCYSAYVARPGWLVPATAMVTPAERSTVWQRSVGILVDEGYVPQVLNSGACYVSARQREDEVPDGSLVRNMAIVTIAPDGLVRVEVSGFGYYQSLNEMNQDIGRRQQRLLRRILNQPEPTVGPQAMAEPPQ
jgi:hypothetical protein